MKMKKSSICSRSYRLKSGRFGQALVCDLIIARQRSVFSREDFTENTSIILNSLDYDLNALKTYKDINFIKILQQACAFQSSMCFIWLNYETNCVLFIYGLFKGVVSNPDCITSICRIVDS
jgi:hypothetical protein